MTEWTVDTNILREAINTDNSDYLHFLWDIKDRKDMICIDDKGYIDKEYRKTLDSRKETVNFIRNWYNYMISRSMIKKYCGILDYQHKENLTKCEFHHKDLPFVAVCYISGSHLLVSIDSVYRKKKVNDYLTQSMKLTIFCDIKNARKHCNPAI